MNERRYRQAERRLWESVGVAPRERRIHLAQARVDARVQETGEGEAILFLHGAPISGSSWAWLASQLGDFRCLLVDRPGTGLSDALEHGLTLNTLPHFADEFVTDVLDGLGLRSAHVLGGSVGGYLALRSAAAAPERIAKMALVGSPAFVQGTALPAVMRLMSLRWVRRLIETFPQPVARIMLLQLGEGPSLRAGRIPEAVFDWYLALQRFTDTMRNDGEMLGLSCSLFDPGFAPQLTLKRELLARVTMPTLLVWGENETLGGPAVAQRLVKFLPDARLVIVPRSGHLPQFDEPALVARAIRGHFTRRPDVPRASHPRAEDAGASDLH